MIRRTEIRDAATNFSITYLPAMKLYVTVKKLDITFPISSFIEDRHPKRIDAAKRTSKAVATIFCIFIFLSFYISILVIFESNILTKLISRAITRPEVNAKLMVLLNSLFFWR